MDMKQFKLLINSIVMLLGIVVYWIATINLSNKIGYEITLYIASIAISLILISRPIILK